MLVPFGTRVLDSTGKSVGTVSRVILHPQSREVAGLVVHQGVLNRREVVVPLTKVLASGDEVKLAVPGAELAAFDLFHSAALQPMPDHWDMPVGFDQRDFFLVGTDAWADSVLPFEPTSPAASGTPALRARPGRDHRAGRAGHRGRHAGLRPGWSAGRGRGGRGVRRRLAADRPHHRPARIPVRPRDQHSGEPGRVRHRPHRAQRERRGRSQAGTFPILTARGPASSPR